ncbi:hypothetical protein [Cupriavidus pinatubonensis]|uniref:Transmembrane protein n=2 Tax=Cupriavidus pinatubonensis TaxID=248026 RepID=A0ABN7YCR9_9BURK|nr:hypothetical protein [Cupriavidus pinatubonensis]CAG9169735.1 hypothetical protein LMG23994_01637 [Cupriavidus pinatubonensis]
MQLNVFEGARRIAKLVVGLWIAGWCIVAATSEPYLSRTYLVVPGHPPTSAKSDSCEVEDRADWKTIETKNGTTVHVRLCFIALKATDGTYFIPTEGDPSTHQYSGRPKYDKEVDAYTTAVTSSFALSKADEEALDKLYWPEKWKQISDGSRWVGGGILAIWFVAMIVGWIVRGFMGIPWGQDRRPDDPKGRAEDS